MTPLSGKELAKLVESKGWTLLRVNGSHHVYARSGVNVRLSIPIHGSSKLKFGLQCHLMETRRTAHGRLEPIGRWKAEQAQDLHRHLAGSGTVSYPLRDYTDLITQKALP